MMRLKRHDLRPRARIELQDGFRPGILCGEDKNEFLYVVMPVSL